MIKYEQCLIVCGKVFQEEGKKLHKDSLPQGLRFVFCGNCGRLVLTTGSAIKYSSEEVL